MGDQRLGGAQVLGQRAEADAGEDAHSRRRASLHLKGEERAAAPLLAERKLVLWERFEAWIEDVRHPRMTLQKAGDPQGVFGVALHAERQRLDSLERQPG